MGRWTRTWMVVGVLTLMPAVGARAQEPGAGLPGTVQLPEALDRVLRDYEVAWRAGDEDALAALFTEDGFVLSGARPPARGREAIRARYADAQGGLALTAWDWSASGDVGFIIGAFALAPGAPPVGKYVLTLRRVEGRWLIHSDMDGPL